MRAAPTRADAGDGLERARSHDGKAQRARRGGGVALAVLMFSVGSMVVTCRAAGAVDTLSIIYNTADSTGANPVGGIVRADNTNAHAIPVNGFDLDLSADASRVVYSAIDPASGVYKVFMAKVDGTGARRLTVDSASNSEGGPRWSPDQKRVAFWTSDPAGNVGIMEIVNADGSGLVNLGFGSGPDWSPDGTQLTFGLWASGAGAIFVSDTTGGHRRKLTALVGGTGAGSPRWSPDGKHIAFLVSPVGHIIGLELVVVNLDGTPLPIAAGQLPGVISSAPTWAPDGHRLAVMVMSVSNSGVTGQPSEIVVLRTDELLLETLTAATGALSTSGIREPYASAPCDARYWLVASDGGIFTFGNAGFYGSTGAIRLNQPIVGMAATPDGKGYWLVAADGGIFSFGSAGFYGSTGSMHLSQPIVGMAASPDGKGYWLVAADGGIFNFGSAAFRGSAAGIAGAPVRSIQPSPTGRGYTVVGSDGQIYPYGDAQFCGSPSNSHLNKALVGAAA